MTRLPLLSMKHTGDEISWLGTEEIVQMPASIVENPVPPAVTVITLPALPVAELRVIPVGAASTLKALLTNTPAGFVSVTVIVSAIGNGPATAGEIANSAKTQPFEVIEQDWLANNPGVRADRVHGRVGFKANPPPLMTTLPFTVPNPIGALAGGAGGGRVDEREITIFRKTTVPTLSNVTVAEAPLFGSIVIVSAMSAPAVTLKEPVRVPELMLQDLGVVTIPVPLSTMLQFVASDAKPFPERAIIFLAMPIGDDPGEGKYARGRTVKLDEPESVTGPPEGQLTVTVYAAPPTPPATSATLNVPRTVPPLAIARALVTGVPVIEQSVPSATVAPVAVTSIATPGVPNAWLKVTTRAAACTIGLGDQKIEAESTEATNSTTSRTPRAVILRHATMISHFRNI